MRYTLWETSGSMDRPKAHHESEELVKLALLDSIDVIQP